MIKKLIVSSILLAATALSLVAGSITVAWDPYVGDSSVDTIKVYVATGTNTAFLPGNSNAFTSKTTAVTNTTLSISNLAAGQYTLVATAISTNGLESSNSTSATGFVPLGGVLNFRIQSIP